MKIKMQEVYITQDNQEFIRREEADKHERYLKIKILVDSFYHQEMDLEDLAKAIAENRDAFYRAFS